MAPRRRLRSFHGGRRRLLHTSIPRNRRSETAKPQESAATPLARQEESRHEINTVCCSTIINCSPRRPDDGAGTKEWGGRLRTGRGLAMKLGAMLGALLMLVSITTLTGINSASATIRIHD